MTDRALTKVAGLARMEGTGVLAAARAFADGLSARQRALLLQPRTAERAMRWSNLPQGYLGGRGRFGLPTGTLDPQQWDALLDLLAAATGGTSSLGLRDLLEHLAADDELVRRGAGPKYGRGQFFIAFLGAPDEQTTWQLQFGGHHLAMANTYAHDVLIGATPAFRGIEPFPSFLHDGRRLQPERALQRACADLVDALNPSERRAAGLRRPVPDLLLGPGADWVFPRQQEGVRVAELDPARQELVLAVLRSFTDRLPDANARRWIDAYRAELNGTSVAFAGSGAMDAPGDYLRVDGPSAWVEFSMHHGIVTDDPHPHAVWRDRRCDYGGDFRSR